MKDYSIFTTHRDPTGNAAGHKQNLERLAERGHQLRVMSADQYGVIYEAFDVADKKGVEAIAVYRPTSEGQGESSKKWNYGQSYPWNTVGHNYTLPVETAAQNHIWAYYEHLKQIPEWDKRTWFLFFNEIDHEKLEYCADVALLMAKHAVAHGLKFAFFGMNSGEPDPEQWTQPKTSALLHYMAAHPENVALALHEYSFDKDILNDFGFLVGRYLHLVDACRDNGIDFENIRIFITEGGHGKDMALSPDSWIQTVDNLATVYSDYPNIQMFAFWAISDSSTWDGPQLSAVVREAFDYSAQKSTEHDPIIKEFGKGGSVPPPEDKHKAIVLKAPQPREFSRDQWQTLAEYAYKKAHTMTASHDDTLSLLRAGRDDSYVKIVYPDLGSQMETIGMVEAAGYKWVDVTGEVFNESPKPIDPEPLPIDPSPPPIGKYFDISQYLCPGGLRQYIIKTTVNGQETNEKYRPQTYKNGHLIQKNGQGEYYEYDKDFIYLVWDTTPDAGTFYRRWRDESNSGRAPYCKRYMRVGESWQDNQGHGVKFYAKSNCSLIASDPRNSSPSNRPVQVARLVQSLAKFTTPYGAVFDDVIVISTGHERQYYAKNFGRIGWEMPINNGTAWATSEDINNQKPHPLQLPSCLL